MRNTAHQIGEYNMRIKNFDSILVDQSEMSKDYFDIMLVHQKKIEIRGLLKGHGECAASSIKSNLSVLVIRYAKICILKCV